MAHGRSAAEALADEAALAPSGLGRKRCVGTHSPTPEVVRTGAEPSSVGARPAVFMVGPGGGGGGLENANPLVYRRQGERPTTAREQDEGLPDAIDDREIFDLIRGIHDPEHPLTLEELNVVEQLRVQVSDAQSAVSVEFTPTIPHCSMATLIGLSIKVKLIRSLPERFKVDVHITPGTHASEHAVNKQLADKERVAAALENMHLLQVVNQCLSGRS